MPGPSRRKTRPPARGRSPDPQTTKMKRANSQGPTDAFSSGAVLCEHSTAVSAARPGPATPARARPARPGPAHRGLGDVPPLGDVLAVLLVGHADALLGHHVRARPGPARPPLPRQHRARRTPGARRGRGPRAPTRARALGPAPPGNVARAAAAAPPPPRNRKHRSARAPRWRRPRRCSQVRLARARGRCAGHGSQVGLGWPGAPPVLLRCPSVSAARLLPACAAAAWPSPAPVVEFLTVPAPALIRARRAGAGASSGAPEEDPVLPRASARAAAPSPAPPPRGALAAPCRGFVLR